MEVETITNVTPETTKAPDAKVDASLDKVAEKRSSDAGGDGKPTETPAERKHRIKFGKQEREVGDAELIAMAQKGWAADTRFQEAAKMKKEVEDAIKNGDLASLVKKLKGKDELEYAKDVVRNYLKKQNMKPEERELADHQERIEKLKAEEAAIQKRRDEAEMSEKQRHYEEQYDKELSDAIGKHKLPKTHAAINRAISIASKVVDLGLEPNWDLVVQEAKRQMVDEYRELFEALEDGSLMEMLGEPLARRVSKALIGKTMPKLETKANPPKGKDAFRPEPDRTPVDSEEWFEKKRAAWSK